MKIKKAFTLIELLVVISIIIILIGLTSAGVRSAMKKAKQQKAKTECLALLAAVNRFYSETGIYPEEGGSGSIKEDILGKKLTKQDVYGSADTTLVFGPYYEFKNTNSTGTTPNRVPADPWGNPYIIVLPDGNVVNAQTEATTAHDNSFVIIYSQGPDDAATATDDDIGTWQ